MVAAAVAGFADAVGVLQQLVACSERDFFDRVRVVGGHGQGGATNCCVICQ